MYQENRQFLNFQIVNVENFYDEPTCALHLVALTTLAMVCCDFNFGVSLVKLSRLSQFDLYFILVKIGIKLLKKQIFLQSVLVASHFTQSVCLSMHSSEVTS